MSNPGGPCIHCGECCMEVVCPVGEIIMGTAEPPCPALASDNDGKYWCGLIVAPENTMFNQSEWAKWYTRKISDALKTMCFNLARGATSRPDKYHLIQDLSDKIYESLFINRKL